MKMKLITEYHFSIPTDFQNNFQNDFQNSSEDLPIILGLKSRFVAHVNPGDGFSRTELHFRIEENPGFAMRAEFASLYPRHKYSDGPWMVLGSNTWSASSELPNNVSPREFYSILNLLSGNTSNSAGKIIMNLFHELEIAPAYETEKSWVKDAVPRWFDSLLKAEENRRTREVQEVMKS